MGDKIRLTNPNLTEHWNFRPKSIKNWPALMFMFLFLDHIFDQNATNQIIFDKMAKQIVHAAVKGFNGTIFAYGQTSSGKF